MSYRFSCAAQFEPRDNDKAYNLSRIRELTRRAVEQGAEIVSFHECCIPGYTWVQPLQAADCWQWPNRCPTARPCSELIRDRRPNSAPS